MALKQILTEPNKVLRQKSLPVEKVDMLTLILIGNSSSFVKEGFVLTPRGY